MERKHLSFLPCKKRVRSSERLESLPTSNARMSKYMLKTVVKYKIELAGLTCVHDLRAVNAVMHSRVSVVANLHSSFLCASKFYYCFGRCSRTGNR